MRSIEVRGEGYEMRREGNNMRFRWDLEEGRK